MYKRTILQPVRCGGLEAAPICSGGVFEIAYIGWTSSGSIAESDSHSICRTLQFGVGLFKAFDFQTLLRAESQRVASLALCVDSCACQALLLQTPPSYALPSFPSVLVGTLFGLDRRI